AWRRASARLRTVDRLTCRRGPSALLISFHWACRRYALRHRKRRPTDRTAPMGWRRYFVCCQERHSPEPHMQGQARKAAPLRKVSRKMSDYRTKWLEERPFCSAAQSGGRTQGTGYAFPIPLTRWGAVLGKVCPRQAAEVPVSAWARSFPALRL